MTSIMGDIRDYSHVHDVCKKYKPEIVIHMAAQSLVKYSYINPVETFSTNILGLVNILEAARKVGCAKSIVIVTSDKCYENRFNQNDHIESDAMGGQDPYSSSKGCAELVTHSYIDSFFNQEQYDKQGIAVASARAGNVIGGGDWAKDRLIVDIVNAWTNSRPLIIRYPEAIRPWQHVLEALSGYLLLAEKLFTDGMQYSGPWNFGPDNDNNKSVKWIIENVSLIVNKHIDWSAVNTAPLYESDYLALNCKKAKQELLWESHLNLEKTLRWVVNWYVALNENSHDMKLITIEQIKKYQELL